MNTEEVNIISGETKYVENKVNDFLQEKPHFQVISTTSHNRVKTTKTKAKGDKPAGTKKTDVTILTVTLARFTR